MGLSSKTQKSETKPIYGAQIEGAAANVSNAYNTQAPKLSAITDMLGGFAPGLAEQYTQGDPTINAAKGYNSDVLGGKYLNGSPQLDAIVSQTNDSTRNGLASSLGTRGLTGGSAFADIISRGLAQNETGLRFNNYNTERGRMDTVASQAPALASASYLPLSILQSIAQTQQMPIQAAAGAGSSIGGLLGQYTKGKQTYNPSTMDNIGQAFDIGKTIAGFI